VQWRVLFVFNLRICFTAETQRAQSKSMKIITNITPEGITYLDDNNNQQFIDFEICHQNNLRYHQKRLGEDYTEEQREFWEKSKFIALRYALSQPPSLLFYTIPSIEIHFPSKSRLYDVVVYMKKMGWRTHDGE
jgi:hypothetical protein